MDPSRSKKMEYDPETGCYRRITPLDFTEQKVEDIVKTELKKSEVKMKLRSEAPAWRQTEEKERGSNPDSSLEDLTVDAQRGGQADTAPYYVSGDSIQTEYQFTLKEEAQSESSPGGEEKNGEFADEDIKKAGDAIKAKFDKDRMKFEQDTGDAAMTETTKRSYERRRSQEDPQKKKAREDTRERSMSLEKKIKDMEERRARMLRRHSGESQDNDDTIKITRTITTETSYNKDDDNTEESPRDEARNRRLRIREERTKRRLASEGLASDTKSDESKTPQVKSAGVKLELRGSGFAGKEMESSFDGYTGHDDASDITFTVKKPAEKTDNIKESDKEKVSSKTTKTVSLSGSLMDEPNVWSYTRPDVTDDITFTVKESVHKKEEEDVTMDTRNGKPIEEDLVQEQEVKVEESEPVQSRFSEGFNWEEPEDIVFTVKKTTTQDQEDQPSKFVKKEIVLEERSFDPKTDLISWEEDNVDSGDKSIFKDVKVEPPKEQVPSTEYQGSLARVELSRDKERRRKEDRDTGDDSIDGYKGSLGRSDVNQLGSPNRDRPVVLHDIEADSYQEQQETQMESPSEELSSQDFQAPIISRYPDKAAEDERRKRRWEIEEKQRQIMEKQKRASFKNREKSESPEKKTEGPTTPEPVEDLRDKRRSLLMMWESYVEGEGPGPENKMDSEEKRRTSFGYEKMMQEASQSPNGLSSDVVGYREMDVEDENEEPRAPLVEVDEHHKLNEDELKWERAGQFQPNPLKTKFHDLQYDEPSANNIVFETKKTWKTVNNNEPDDTSTNYGIEQRYSYQPPADEDQSYVIESSQVESAPVPLWDEKEDQSTHKDDDDDDEEERKPRVDVDTLNRMTEEEAQWERVGHFQPGKINTSIFEAKTNAEHNERQGSQKFRKSEKSKYEQIQKIQRTNSKKELLVPKKVALQASDNSDIMERDDEERPKIGKIEKSSLIYETTTDEERQRREKEERNRREMEEIQREREEERRRQERQERETASTINDFDDDEFDAKVKAKNIRHIDISKFGEFQKAPQSAQERKAVAKTPKRYSGEIINTQGVETLESAPPANEEDIFELKFQQEKPKPQDPVRKSSVKKEDKRTYSQEIVTTQTVKEVESAPVEISPEEEYELKRRSVGKLNTDWMSQIQEQERREAEKRREELEFQKRKKDQEEREILMREETQGIQPQSNEGYEVSNVGDKPQNVKKLDSNAMSPFLKGGKSPEKKKSKDEIRQERKLARKESRSKMKADEIVYLEETTEIHQSPETFDGPQNNVGKLDEAKYRQMFSEDISCKERRKQEVEEERVRRELEEMKRQREEEERRNQQFESEEFPNDTITDKPQNVSKLDLSQFSQFQQRNTEVPVKRPVKTSAEKPRDKEQTKKESVREQETIQMSVVEEVHSAPEIVKEEKPKKTSVGALDFNQLTKSFTSESEEKKRRLEEVRRERIRRENEERELLLLEQQRQGDLPSRRKSEEHVETTTVEEVQSVPTNLEIDEMAFEERPKKSVQRLDVNKYMKSFNEEAEEKRKRLQEMERERIRREKEEREILLREQQRHRDPSPPRQSDVIAAKTTTAQKVQPPPEQEKRKKSIPGQLDVEKYMKSFNDEAEEKRRRLREMEKERIRRENEEREILLMEQQRHRDAEPPSREVENDVVIETTVQDVQSSPIDFDDNEARYRIIDAPAAAPEKLQNGRETIIEREREEQFSVEEKRKTPGQLDLNNIMQSFLNEEETKRRRAMELEQERRLRDEEEKQMSRLELRKKSSSGTVNVRVAQEVQSSPSDNLFLDEKNTRNNTERERRTSEKREPIRRGSQKKEEVVVNHSDVRPSGTIMYDDNSESSQKRKSVGKLDLSKFSQSIDQETRERERRSRQLEIERLRLEREEMENVNQTINSERMDSQDTDVRSDANDGGIDSNKPIPGKLDFSKFSAFGGGGLRITKDDSAVKRRENPQSRQARPKSFAGRSFGGVANGNTGYGGKEYRISNQ